MAMLPVLYLLADPLRRSHRVFRLASQRLRVRLEDNAPHKHAQRDHADRHKPVLSIPRPQDS